MNLFAENYPLSKRPTLQDDNIIENVVDKLEPKVEKWLDDKDSSESVRKELANMLKSESDWSDGYVLARYLENKYYWDADGCLSDILNECFFLGKLSLEDKIKNWIKDGNLMPLKKIGDIIEVEKNNTKRKAKIMDVVKERYQYVVSYDLSINAPSKFGYLINCETID